MRTENVRESRFELLRIVGMAVIILAHYSYHGGILFQELSLNQVLAQFLKIGGKLGVTCYVLIGAYFLVDSKFKMKNIIRIFLQVAFYAILIFIALCIYKPSTFCADKAADTFNYWFATAYIGMYALSPILNYLIHHMTRAMHEKVIIVLTTILSVLPFLFLQLKLFYSDILWFVFLYFIGGYIKEYPIEKIEAKRAQIFILSTLFIFCSSVAMVILGQRYPVFLKGAYIFSNINSPVLLLSGIGLFLIFKNIDLGKNKYINYIALSTFGVYLLHDNDISRDVFWHDLFRTERFYDADTILFLLYAVLIVIAIFAAAMVLEIPRRRVEKWILDCKWLTAICSKIDRWYVLQ